MANKLCWNFSANAGRGTSSSTRQSPFVPTQPSPSPSGSLSISPLADADAFCLFAFPGTQRKFTSQSELGREAAAEGGPGGGSLTQAPVYAHSARQSYLFYGLHGLHVLHDSGAQCWQHLTVFFQLIKGCFYFNVRFSHFITLAGQCSQNCLTGFSYRKKYIKKIF